ncbi:MAG TPA: PAS domain S-box protein [Opitutus sp.]|nr:PAS domain S-box protein [Opitutus sp.]
MRDLRRLHEVTVRLGRATELGAALQDLLEAASDGLGAAQGWLALCEPDGTGIRAVASKGVAREFLRSVEQSPAAHVCGPDGAKPERVVVEDVSSSSAGGDWQRLAELGGFVALHSAPLISGGERVGVLAVHFAEPHVPDERERELMDLFAQMAADFVAKTRATQTLRESEERFRLLASHAPVGIFLSDVNGDSVFLNRTWCELAGMTEAQARGKGWTKALHPDDRERVNADWERAVRQGTPSAAEFRFRRPDGSERWLQGSAVQMRDAAGRITGHIGTIVDVTERKEAELAVRESEQRLRVATATGKVGVWDWDVKNNRVAWTDSLYAIHGVDRAQFDGTVEGFARLVHPDDRGRVEQNIGRALAGDAVYETEFRAVRPDGRIVWLFTNAVVLRDGEGQTVRMLGATLDVTDRKQAELALAESELRNRQVVQSMPVATYMCDAAGRLMLYNEAAVDLWGCTPVLGRERWAGALRVCTAAGERLPLDSRPEALLTRDGATTGFEAVLERADGSRRYVLAHPHPIRDDAGALLGAVNVLVDLTERRQSDEVSRMLAAIVESSEDAIIGTDLSGTITSWNRGAERLYGYTPAEAIGQPITMIIPEDFGREEPGIALRIERGERVEHYETIRRRKDGVLVDVSLTISPIRNREGRVIGASKIARDITSRKRHEAEVRRQQKIYRAIGESIDYGIWVCDSNGRNIYASESFLKLVGMTQEECSEFGWGRVLPPEEIEATMAAWKEAVATGTPFEREHRFKGVDGKWHPVLARGVPVRDEDGKIACWAGINLDIAAFKETEAALRGREEQLRLVTDNAIVFLAQCDRDYRLRFVNRPYAARFGRAPEELVGLSIADLVGEAAFASFKPQIDAALQGRRVEFEMEIPYENFGKRWMRVIHEPERAPNGEVVGLVAVITDITARKQAEREMEAARDKALAASRAKDDFLAALSHELRTPLNPVLLLASEAAANLALAPEVRADFETIRKNVELEARLIDDLLDLTRITRGKLSLNVAVQDVHTIVRDAMATMRADYEQKRLTLTLDLAAPRAQVWGDPVRLQQVLWNVLKNALKFTPEGGRVAVATRESGERLVIEIRDSGIGMTTAELGRIFDAFSQGDHAGGGGSHRFGGVGLGLAISRMLVEMHHGRIVASSDGRNQGATFTIELPLAQDSIDEAGGGGGAGRSLPPPVARADEKPVCRGRILLVEDHEPTRNALAQLLRRRNFEIAPAANLAEARALAAVGGIDLLISDVGLPDGNGYELMAELGAAWKLPGIALTGYGMDHDVVRSQAAGFLVHLTKPVTVQALDQALAAAMSLKR